MGLNEIYPHTVTPRILKTRSALVKSLYYVTDIPLCLVITVTNIHTFDVPIQVTKLAPKGTESSRAKSPDVLRSANSSNMFILLS
jgi:hypothetical protein